MGWTFGDRRPWDTYSPDRKEIWFSPQKFNNWNEFHCGGFVLLWKSGCSTVLYKGETRTQSGCIVDINLDSHFCFFHIWPLINFRLEYKLHSHVDRTHMHVLSTCDCKTSHRTRICRLLCSVYIVTYELFLIYLPPQNGHCFRTRVAQNYSNSK